jgi:hypothetical protein
MSGGWRDQERERERERHKEIEVTFKRAVSCSRDLIPQSLHCVQLFVRHLNLERQTGRQADR